MKKYLLIFLLIPYLLNAQAINESFNNFVPVNPDSLKGLYVFGQTYHTDNGNGADSVHEDLSAQNNDLTWNGWASYAAVIADMAGTVNPVYSGDDTLKFKASDYFSIADGSAGDFKPGTKDFSIDGWFMTHDKTSTQIVSQCRENGVSGWQIAIINPGNLRAYFDGDAANELPVVAIENDTWYYFAAVADRDGNWSVSVNGGTPATGDISADVAYDMNPSAIFGIGSDGGSYYLGPISMIRFTMATFTAAEIRENWALANGWYSSAGKVTREFSGANPVFHQGFYDGETVFYPFSNSNASWSLTFDAKGTKSGDVVTANVGGNSGVAQTLTASSVEYTLDLGYLEASTDSLFFVASAGDTVYIDNVVLTADTTPNIYVSDQGNDSNLGTSVTQAYLTFAKAYGLTLAAGSTVYLFSDDGWRETWTQGVSGSSDNQTTLTKVDSATGLTGSSAVGADPIINGADLGNTWVDAGGGVYYTLGISGAVNSVMFNGIAGNIASANSGAVTSTRDWFWTTDGDDSLFIKPALAADTSNIEYSARAVCIKTGAESYITLEYLDIRNARNEGVYSRGGEPSVVSGLIFQNLTITNTGQEAIKVGEDSGVRIPDGVTIDSCTISYWSRRASDNSGVLFHQGDSGGTAVTVSKSTIFADVMPSLGVSNGVNGIQIRSGTAIMVDSNEVYRTDHAIVIRGDSSATGKANGTSIIRYNYTHDNADDALLLDGVVGGNQDVYYNIFDADSGDNCMDLSGLTINAYNNLLLNSYQDALIIGTFPTTINFKNNIIWNWSEVAAQTRYAIVYANDGANPTIGSDTYSNNIYYSSSGKYIGVIATVVHETLGEWQDSTSQDANSLTSDPLFNDATGLDFTLKPNSPAIDAGTPVGIGLDYRGNVVPYGGGFVDIGAYEMEIEGGTSYTRYRAKYKSIYKPY